MTGLQINRKTAQYAIDPVHCTSLLTFQCSIVLETIRTFNIVQLYRFQVRGHATLYCALEFGT